MSVVLNKYITPPHKFGARFAQVCNGLEACELKLIVGVHYVEDLGLLALQATPERVGLVPASRFQ